MRRSLKVKLIVNSEITLVVNSRSGLYCPQGDFYIDPVKPVKRALITHAHSDHARAGNESYLTALPGKRVLRSRLPKNAFIETLNYAERLTIGGVKVSFHPAGHVLGSSQIRLEYKGLVWVVSGDYKTEADPTCAPFELLACHYFLSESTFALPIYRWQPASKIACEINDWWQDNSSDGKISVIFAYSLGKAQRILSLLDPGGGPIYVHSQIAKINRDYRDSGIVLPNCNLLPDDPGDQSLHLMTTLLKGALLLLPPALAEKSWIYRLPNASFAFASGWMRLRKEQKRQELDRTFVLSDHADWDALLTVIAGTQAEQVITMHGFAEPLARHLRGIGVNANTFAYKSANQANIYDREES